MKLFRLTAVALAVTGPLILAAPAATVESQVFADLKVATAHIWRGQVISDDAVIQPSITVTADDWSLNIWGTWDISSTNSSSARTRVDTTIDYTFELEKHILTPGIIAYVYHDTHASLQDDTFEVFLEYAYNVVTLPSITIYYDFGEIEGFYAALALRHSFELVEDRMDLDLRADLGAGDEHYAAAKFSYPAMADGTEAFTPDSPALIDVTFSAGVPVSINESWTITPSVKYMALLDGDIKDATKAAGEDSDGTSLALTVSACF